MDSSDNEGVEHVEILLRVEKAITEGSVAGLVNELEKLRFRKSFHARLRSSAFVVVGLVALIASFVIVVGADPATA
jgi:hypothetical protein